MKKILILSVLLTGCTTVEVVKDGASYKVRDLHPFTSAVSIEATAPDGTKLKAARNQDASADIVSAAIRAGLSVAPVAP